MESENRNTAENQLQAPAATVSSESSNVQQQLSSSTFAETHKNRRPESLNLTSNDSSINLLSNASQAQDTSSLRTNNSSDCIVTYDSDNCWPLSRNSSSSKFNTNQGSATRLDGRDDESASSTAGSETFNRRAQISGNGLQFTIGPNRNLQEIDDDDDDGGGGGGLMYIAGQRHRLGQNEVPMYGHNMNDDDDENNDNGHDDQTYDPHKQVIVGICAMEKKAQSKPMKEILRRLEDYFEYIKTLVFEESVILNKPIEEWPLCDCLISFHSKGFPLSKAIEYARLRRPFLVNDLDIQYDIQDRRKVYKILGEADIELPRYAVLDRDSANVEERELVESDDHIEVANFVFNKPFVEKPISAEDHNICIYYPAHAGGGSQRLFRKIGCRSSVYSNESHVRKTGSYIYEEFMPTDGTDVKVYTAGPDYAHAEARKSPALDGKVERDVDGKEIRYPVILTNREKLIARKVCLAFKQAVCGFDLLRANGRSYVCDVNGFSFVKSSMKYYEDCSKILGNMMLRALAPQLHIPWSIPFQLDDPPIVPTTFGRMMELRCVIAVIRHGDRTPKQKMKLEVKHSKFFELYHKYGNTKNGQAKLKKPKQLQEVLDIARYLLGELQDQPLTGEVVEPRVKLRQLKSVLEMYGHFSGINRKVQLKYQPHGRPRRSSSEDEVAREPSLVLILKWGGELTPAGRVQAEDLGRCFRRLYPASGDYSGPQGLGLLRLHSTFRHDLKIYASDEGRVQMTAAAFAKGFLALEGELTPILFQMVKSANTNGLLDNDCESSKCQKIVKERLHDIMQKNLDLTSEDMELLNPTGAPSIEAACKFIANPYQACEKVHKLIKDLNTLIKSKRQDNCYTQEYHLYHGETWDLLQRRWAKLEKDFKFPRSKRFDISKIPDIYDCIKYDLQHNQHTLQFQSAHELHTYAKALADIVIPQEYGMTSQEKLMISLGTCSPLLRKIQADLIRNADSSNEDEDTESVNRLDPKYSHGVSSPDRHVRTRLYFTSESHIHSLVTALQYGGLLDVKRDEQWQRSMEFLSAISELNYLSQIVIMLYEDPTKEPSSNDRFHVEIHFSSGVINRISQQNMPTEPQGPGFRPHLHNKGYSNASSTESGISKGTESDDSPGVRLRMSAMKQDSGMIKEELTDDERSVDGDSRVGVGNSHSRGSSVCLSPAGKPLDQDKLSARSCATNKSPIGSANTEESDNEDNQTLTQLNARQLLSLNNSQGRCLSRSYSAVTPISLQDLFNKKEIESSLSMASQTRTAPNNNGPVDISDVKCEEICKQEARPLKGLTNVQTNEVSSSESLRVVANNGTSFGQTSDPADSCSSSTKLPDCRSETAAGEFVRDDSTKAPSPEITKQSGNVNNSVDSDGRKSGRGISNGLQREQQQSQNIAHQETANKTENDQQTSRATTADCKSMAADDCSGKKLSLTGSGETITRSTALPTPKIPERNNWKTYEQYLASELTSSPHLLHQHYYQRRPRCRNQLDQQLINLPPTYHTIHHWNFSPSTLNSIGHQPTSASMSTSPHQHLQGSGSNGGHFNLPQRYFAHKQQQAATAAVNKQYSTISASMPIQFRSSQNPRACSVADVSQYCGGPSSLISTAVISGSSPELVAVCPYSPTIRPLETLHNELSLKQFNEFITRLTRSHRCSSNPLEGTGNPTSAYHRHHNEDYSNLNDDVARASMKYGQQQQQQQQQQLTKERSLSTNSTCLASRSLGSSIAGDNRLSGQLHVRNANNSGSNGNTLMAFSPGNSLNNSLIWSGPPSSFASSAGPSSPSAAFELWSKLELEELVQAGGEQASIGNNVINANSANSTVAANTVGSDGSNSNSGSSNNTNSGPTQASANQ